jgi:nitrate/nitrite-specific signal transduction histidine kinase
MGLDIMRYRAGMIGGSLEVKRAGERGTTVACRFSGLAG